MIQHPKKKSEIKEQTTTRKDGRKPKMHTFLWVDVADAGAQREEEAFFNGAIKSMIIKMAHLSCENLLGNSFDQLDRLTSTLALHDDTIHRIRTVF